MAKENHMSTQPVRALGTTLLLFSLTILAALFGTPDVATATVSAQVKVECGCTEVGPYRSPKGIVTAKVTPDESTPETTEIV
jgi:hypothetical protein